MKNILNTKKILFIVKLLGVGLIFLILNYFILGQWLVTLFSLYTEPVSYWVGGRTSDIVDKVDLVSNFVLLQEQNNQLRVEVAQLEAQNAVVQLLLEENRLLSQQLVLGEKDADILQASVLHDCNVDGVERLIINRGKVDGVKVGDSVIIGNVYVGSISKVLNQSSEVRTPYSRESFLHVLISKKDLSALSIDELRNLSQSKVQFIEGVGVGHKLRIDVENILVDQDVNQGDWVLVDDSQLSEYYVLGSVSKVDLLGTDVSQTVTVSPVYNFSKLKFVFVKL